MQPQRIACKGWTPLLYLCHYAQSTSQPCKTLKQSRAQLALTRPNSTPGARSDASMHILTPARRRALINQQELVGGLIEGGGLSIVIISGLDLIGIESPYPAILIMAMLSLNLAEMNGSRWTGQCWRWDTRPGFVQGEAHVSRLLDAASMCALLLSLPS